MGLSILKELCTKIYEISIIITVRKKKQRRLVEIEQKVTLDPIQPNPISCMHRAVQVAGRGLGRESQSTS